MSWDPNTALVVYQPIDLYALAAKGISKSINSVKFKLEQIEKDLSSCEPKPRAQGYWYGRTITTVKSGISGTSNAVNEDVIKTKILKLTDIQSSIKSLAEDLNAVTRGFERKLELEIQPVNSTIVRLNQITESWLAKHQEILFSQQKFSRS